MTGVACSVLAQLDVAALTGFRLLGKLFCQTVLPLSASIANKVSSMPMVKTIVLPSTCATSGELRVDSAVSCGVVGSWLLHSSFILPTLAGDSVVSALFQPLRCWS